MEEKKIKALGNICLHYGSDYLEYAIRSMYNCVDEILILYSPKPSHAADQGVPCPETEEQLYAIAQDNDPDGKIKWFQGNWKQENAQRNYAHEHAKLNGFNILVTTDADEVWWSDEVLNALIQLTYERKAKSCLVWMRHLWRSFNFICDDGMRQERLHYIGDDRQDLIYAEPNDHNQVWHFGYARKPSAIHYKIGIHGHSAEWLQPKEKWFANKFLPFPPAQETHPCCKGVWNPAAFDKAELPEMMREHPYYNLEVIND